MRFACGPELLGRLRLARDWVTWPVSRITPITIRHRVRAAFSIRVRRRRLRTALHDVADSVANCVGNLGNKRCRRTGRTRRYHTLNCQSFRNTCIFDAVPARISLIQRIIANVYI